MNDRILLIRHPRPVPNTVPALDFVLKYIDQCPNGTTHQFWDTQAASRYLNSAGQAVLVLKVKPTAATRMVSRGTYSVVRTLLEHQKRPLQDVYNICGLAQCVNPLHWRAPEPIAPFKLDPARGVVHAADGSPITKDTAVRLRGLDGVVHVARALPGALPRLLCGAAFDPLTALVVTAPVTCTKGC